MFVKISTNQCPQVRSWPCRLHESEIRGQGNQSFFSLSLSLCDLLSLLHSWLSLSWRRSSRKTSGTRVDKWLIWLKMSSKQNILEGREGLKSSKDCFHMKHFWFLIFDLCYWTKQKVIKVWFICGPNKIMSQTTWALSVSLNFPLRRAAI